MMPQGLPAGGYRRALIWTAGATGLLLLVPLVAMQFTDEVNWKADDFLLMGLMLFVTGSLLTLAWQRTATRLRVLALITIAALFLYVWAELAVGLFF